MNTPTLVAEIGCNHKGELSIAKELIETAASYCKAPAIKLQKRNPKESLTQSQYESPHPNPYHSYGDTYGKHREFLEFTIEQHAELKEYCESKGITYSCSVWDLSSTREICSLNPDFIKIPSACNLDFEILTHLCENFTGDIHISTGMTTQEEIAKIVNFLSGRGRSKDTILYSCTSGYPVPFEDICLLEIERLKSRYGEKVKGIGFSGHHLGIAADIAAMTLGATWIERHYTLDRTWRGTDHAASLEPDGLRKLARDLAHVSQSLRYKDNEILEIERPQLEKLKRVPGQQPE